MKNMIRFIFVASLLLFRSCEYCPASNIMFPAPTDPYGNPTNVNVTLTQLEQPIYYGGTIAYSTPQTFQMTNFSLTISNVMAGNYLAGYQGLNRLIPLTVPPDTNTYTFTLLITSNVTYYAKLANIFALWSTNLDAWANLNPWTLAAYGGTNFFNVTNITWITNTAFSTNTLDITNIYNITNTTLLTNTVNVTNTTLLTNSFTSTDTNWFNLTNGSTAYPLDLANSMLLPWATGISGIPSNLSAGWALIPTNIFGTLNASSSYNLYVTNPSPFQAFTYAIHIWNPGTLPDLGITCYSNGAAFKVNQIMNPEGNVIIQGAYSSSGPGSAFNGNGSGLTSLGPTTILATNSPANGYALRYTNGTFYWAP